MHFLLDKGYFMLAYRMIENHTAYSLTLDLDRQYCTATPDLDRWHRTATTRLCR